MANYEEAVRKPFTDLKKLIIGIILTMIPIVNFTVVPGFAIESSGLSKTKKSKKMPDWKNLGRLFIQGVAALVIKIVYMLPAVLVIALGIGLAAADLSEIFIGTITTSDLIPQLRAAGTSSEASGMIREMLRENWYLVLPTLLKIAPILLAGFLLALIGVFLTPMAVLNYVKNKRFSAAFEFGTVCRKAATGEYVIAWLAVIILATILAAVLSMIPFVGQATAYFVIWVITYSLYGDVYRKVK